MKPLLQFHRCALAATVALAFTASVAISPDARAYFQDGGQSPGFHPMKPKPGQKKSTSNAPSKYPNATRKEPEAGISPSLFPQIKALLDEVNTPGHEDDAIATGGKLAASKDAKAIDQAYIDEAIAYAYINKNDDAKAIEFMQKSVDLDALPNDDHYDNMVTVAKLQIRAGQSDAGLASLARVVSETHDDKPEYNVLRGTVFYAKKDYANAAKVLEKVLATQAKPDPAVQQTLLSCYMELNQVDRAEKLGEDILHANPGDKDAINNLVVIYQQAGHDDKAVVVLDDARKRGVLADADGYRTLYSLYTRMKGHENDSIAVINEGLQKGILKPTQEVYVALGDDYYFTSRTPEAIDAYKKADAVATDGEAALNLAKIYSTQGQPAEARTAAQRALQKGIKSPKEAQDIISRTGGSPAAVKHGKKK